MKKLKLLTTLSTLGIVGAAVPVISTSCNKEDTSNYIVYKGEKINFDGYTFRQSDITALDDDHIAAIPYIVDGQPSETESWPAYIINGKPYDVRLITEIHIGSATDIEEIPARFLASCYSLRIADFGGIKGVARIDDDFLAGCSQLSWINLPTLRKLSDEEIYSMFMNGINQVEDNFLAGAISLEYINLKPFANLVTIPDNFLNCVYDDANPHGNMFLKSLDFSSWKNVAYIGKNFLNACLALESVKLPTIKPLSLTVGGKAIELPVQTGTIGDSFMSFCPNIRELDFTPLANVTSIGDYFMCSYVDGNSNTYYAPMPYLKKLDFSMMTNVTKIGDGFCIGPVFATEVKLPTMVEGKKGSDMIETEPEIGGGFLSGLGSLESIDLTPLKKLTYIPDAFFAGCSSLKTIDLSPLTNVTNIGTDFLMYCASLKVVDLTPMTALQTEGKDASATSSVIGESFLYACNALEELDMGYILAKLVGAYNTQEEADEKVALTKVAETGLEEDPDFSDILIVGNDKDNYVTKFPAKAWSSAGSGSENIYIRKLVTQQE